MLYRRLGSRLGRFYSQFPTHFGNANAIPETYKPEQERETYNETHHETYKPEPYKPEIFKPEPLPPTIKPASQEGPKGHEASVRELTSLLAMFVLAYLAVDNYVSRTNQEKANAEATAINIKTLQLQQANFLNARKKKDLQIIQERRERDKRDFKMALHIALLRKQLADKGTEPVDLDTAIREFESSVKALNSIKNLSGQALWIDDDSPLKKYLPSAHEYDKRKLQNDSTQANDLQK